MNSPFRSHQISQVLLKQFAVNGKVAIFRDNCIPVFCQPDCFAHVIEDKALYQSTEAEWQRVETRFNDMIRWIENGELLSNDEYISIAKKVIILHAVRSFSMQSLFKQYERESFEELRASYTGAINAAELRELWEEGLDSLKLQIIRKTILDAESFLNSSNLEILENVSRTGFILGDNPVVNLGPNGLTGVLQGVSIDNSKYIFLPVSPRYALSLNNTHRPTQNYMLGNELIRLHNRKTRNQIISEFYAKI